MPSIRLDVEMHLSTGIFTTFFLIATLSLAQASEGTVCHLQQPCSVGERSYHIRLPDNWDGKSPMPVLLHFHGWGRQGTLIVRHKRIAGATRARGVLLLAPNGRGRTWRFNNPRSDDIAFIDAMIEDAAKRWPIDRSRIFVSGYSWGGSMAWRYVCARGETVAAMLSISGTLYDQNEKCISPVPVRHVHGTSDTVMDYPLAPDGGLAGPVALWLRQNGCTGEPATNSWQAVKILPFERWRWTHCASGKPVTLDIHQRGHFIPRFWIARQLDELL